MNETESEQEVGGDEYRRFACCICSSLRTVKSFCIDCERYYCARCKRSHHDTRSAYRNHQILKGPDIPGEITLQELKEKENKVYCTKHSKRLIKIICHDHNEFCCETCIQVSEEHFRCKTSPIQDKDFDKVNEDHANLQHWLLESIVYTRGKKAEISDHELALETKKLEITSQIENDASKMVTIIQDLKIKAQDSVNESFDKELALAKNEIEKRERSLEEYSKYLQVLDSQAFQSDNKATQRSKLNEIQRDIDASLNVCNATSDCVIPEYSVNETLMSALQQANTVGQITMPQADDDLCSSDTLTETSNHGFSQ